jgi:predicted amidophosphoribosyltransferase
VEVERCPYCGNENSASARFCGRCNSPLDPGSVEEAKKKQKLQEQLVRSVVQRLIEENPTLVENVMKEFQKELAGAG